MGDKKYTTSGQLMEAVNEMEIVLFDIDFYEPSTFFRIVERLRPIIER